MILLMLVTAGGYCLALDTEGKEKSAKAKEHRDTYALVVCGINKEPKERFMKNKAVRELRDFFLNEAKLNPAHLKILTADNVLLSKDSKRSNAENLGRAIKEFAEVVRPEDRFVFYYIGQANEGAGKLRFNLPGRDITHTQLAEWVGRMKASSTLVVLDCPRAGMAVRSLAGEGRIVIGASTAEQTYSTRFSEYFIASLLDSKSDTDGDGRISVLEAFTYASKQLDDWYFERLILKTETPILEDNGDGFASVEPWRYQEGGRDGKKASAFFWQITEVGDL
jgi:hypothetical protein